MQRTIIQANSPWWRIKGRELWEYRDLLRMLVLRDLTAVYKQTVLGPLWFVVQPLAITLVFTVIFGHIAQIPTHGIPPFIFYMSGMLFWNYFQGVVNYAAGSLIANTGILSKVYFPRLIIPLCGVFVNAAHLALNAVLLAGFYLWFLWGGATLQATPWLTALPLLLLHCGLLGLGFGLWVSALTIKYRDLGFALPFLTQLWMYATPVVYPASLAVRPAFQWILWMNPMTSIVESGRYALTGQGSLDASGLLYSGIMTGLVLVSGLFIFNRVQRTFVDTI